MSMIILCACVYNYIIIMMACKCMEYLHCSCYMYVRINYSEFVLSSVVVLYYGHL